MPFRIHSESTLHKIEQSKHPSAGVLQIALHRVCNEYGDLTELIRSGQTKPVNT